MIQTKIAAPDKKISTPESFYEEPSQVVRDGRLSWEEKMVALRNWEMDEKAALVADDENMTSSESSDPGSVHSQRLREVQLAADSLTRPQVSLTESQRSECHMLTAIIAMNIDACMFYRQAAAGVEQEGIEKNYYALEKIHRQIVSDLSLALEKTGHAMWEAESLYLSRYCIFRGLCANLSPASDIEAVAIIGKAEEACEAAVIEALEETGLSPSSRFHLSGCARLLQSANHHLMAIGRLVRAV